MTKKLKQCFISALKKKRNGFSMMEIMIALVVIIALSAGTFFVYSEVQITRKTSQMNTDMRAIAAAATSYSMLSKNGTVPNGTVTASLFALTADNSLDGQARTFLTGDLKDPWGASYTINNTARTITCAGNTADKVPAKTINF